MTNHLAKIFTFELSTEQVAFVPFYKACQKFLCQEVIDFFLVSFHYKYQPACMRLEWEKKIFERWIDRKSKFQINLAEKMHNNIVGRYGKGETDIFEEAFEHTAESLATNYWFDFTKTELFKHLDKKSTKLGGVVKVGYSLKKTMKKEKIPSHVIPSALWFFSWSYDLISVPKCKLEDPASVYVWLSSIGGDKEFIHSILILLRSDPDPIFSQSVIDIFFERPKTISLLFNEMLADTLTLNDEECAELAKAARLKQCGTRSRSYSVAEASHETDSKKVERKKLLKESTQLQLTEGTLKIDPLQLTVRTVKSLQYLVRYFLFKAFRGSVLDELKKRISELYEMSFEGDIDMKYADVYTNVIHGFVSTLFILSEDDDLVRMMYSKVQLLLQLLYNGCYAKFGDHEGSLHATSSVILEFICYCIETPTFIDIKVTNGVKLRPHVKLIVLLIRNFAFKQRKCPVKMEQILNDEVIGQPDKIVHPTLIKYAKWINQMVGLDRKLDFSRINKLIDEYCATQGGLDSIQAQLDCVLHHVLTKGHLIEKEAPLEVNTYIRCNAPLLKDASSKSALKTLQF